MTMRLPLIILIFIVIVIGSVLAGPPSPPMKSTLTAASPKIASTFSDIEMGDGVVIASNRWVLHVQPQTQLCISPSISSNGIMVDAICSEYQSQAELERGVYSEMVALYVGPSRTTAPSFTAATGSPPGGVSRPTLRR